MSPLRCSEQEFFARLHRAGVLVRKRFSTCSPGEVTGYAVALTGDTTREGGPVWFGGGKLAADLTLPKLRCRWDPVRIRAVERFTAVERNALWEHAARTAGVEQRPEASVAPGCRGLSCMKSGLAASRSLPVRLRRAVPPQRPSRRDRGAPNAPAVALACPAASERCARGPGQASALLPAMVAGLVQS